MVLTPAANAAERNYEVVVCDIDGYYSTANVGGYNQNNQYVHTPNLSLGAKCGHQPHWWFKPNRTVEINVKDGVTGDWARHFRELSAACPVKARLRGLATSPDTCMP
ncbi:hypothetical protein DY245_31875 [Streptomyces inhibens]|uniref:Uncharacterized protein n=2 Tax=Streptomyces inhibens TaxID=2293571 RepID=A0A371PVM8_STRIH|nr:hypothetical protein DY245_31875 [Streptomyces inhibens]